MKEEMKELHVWWCLRPWCWSYGGSAGVMVVVMVMMMEAVWWITFTTLIEKVTHSLLILL